MDPMADPAGRESAAATVLPPTPRPANGLPTVIMSSVVRASHQGESHGGVYLVDMATDSIEQVLDWDDPSIDWEGRGGDRGLRGIAFSDDRVFLAASDEIFIYDRGFRPLGSIRNPYLRHCHEITTSGHRLFITSTGFDSVLEYDLAAGRFVKGYCLRFGRLWRVRRLRRSLGVHPRPRLSTFDPNEPNGPEPGDTSHINSVVFKDDTLYVSGVGLRNVWSVRDDGLQSYARIPYGSHNARPFRDGVLLNHTETDRIAFISRAGRSLRSFPLSHYEPDRLLHSGLSTDLARQAFGRGLAVVSDDLIVGGSSPATLTAYQFDPPEILKSINVSMDIRNAVHGLEVWAATSGAGL
jgi:hypothetical protein